MLLIHLFEQQKVDDVDQRGFAEVVAVLVRILGFRDVRENDVEPLVRDAVEPYRLEALHVIRVDARELHGVTPRRYSKASFFG